MIHGRQQQQRDEDRKRRGAFFGACSLTCALMAGLLAALAFRVDHPAVALLLLLVELLIVPPAGWMAARCLTTPGGGRKIHACTAIILIGMALLAQFVGFQPYVMPASWH